LVGERFEGDGELKESVVVDPLELVVDEEEDFLVVEGSVGFASENLEAAPQ
jgi:hypothetical protein